MDETRTRGDSAANRSQSDSQLKALRYQEVTVEYIKENDFAKHPKREYHRLSTSKPLHHGKGYHISKTVVNLPQNNVRLSTRKRLKDPRKIPEPLQREWNQVFKQKRSLTCPLKSCGRTFVSLSGALSHYRWCAGTTNRGESDHVCPNCQNAFRSKRSLVGHRLNCTGQHTLGVDETGKDNSDIREIDLEVTNENETDHDEPSVKDIEPSPASEIPQNKTVKRSKRRRGSRAVSDSEGASDRASDRNDSDCGEIENGKMTRLRRNSVKRQLMIEEDTDSNFTSINKKSKTTQEPNVSLTPAKLSPRKGRGVPPKRLIADGLDDCTPVTSTPLTVRSEAVIPSSDLERTPSTEQEGQVDTDHEKAVNINSSLFVTDMPSPVLPRTGVKIPLPSRVNEKKLRSSHADDGEKHISENEQGAERHDWQTIDGVELTKHQTPVRIIGSIHNAELDESATGPSSQSPYPLAKTKRPTPKPKVSTGARLRMFHMSSESSDDDLNDTTTPLRKRWRLRIRPGRLSEVAIKEEPEDEYSQSNQLTPPINSSTTSVLAHESSEMELPSSGRSPQREFSESTIDVSVQEDHATQSRRTSRDVTSSTIRHIATKIRREKTVAAPVRQSPRKTRGRVIYTEDSEEELSELECQVKVEKEDEDECIESAAVEDVSHQDCTAADEDEDDGDDYDPEISFKSSMPTLRQEDYMTETDVDNSFIAGDKENTDISSSITTPSKTIRRGRGRGRSKKLNRDNDPEDEINNKVWTCPKCNYEYASSTSLKQHVAREHHLVWSPEHPEGIQDMKALFNLIGRCYCTKCGKEVRYYTYFQFHMEWCGREHETEQCTVCQKPVRSMYIVQHLRSHRISQKLREEREEKAKQNAKTVPTQGRVRRKAAQRAMQHLRALEVEMAEVKKLTQREIPIKRRYTTPVERQITPAKRKQFQGELAQTGKIKCIFKGCSHTSEKPDAMYIHIGQCRQPLPDVGTYKCLKCSKEFLLEAQAKNHVTSSQCWKDVMEYDSNNDGSPDNTDEDPDVDLSEDDDDDDLDLDEEDMMSSGDDEGEGSSRSRSHPHREGLSQYSVEAPQSRANQYIFDDMMTWTIKWYRRYDQTNLFPSWKPRKNKWKSLPRHEMPKYLPQSERSPDIVVRGGDNNIMVDVSLALFETTKSEPYMWNAGGPVWAMDWCPTPLGQNARQYLALYCHRKQDDLHIYDDITTNPSLIQLWHHGDPRAKEEPGEMCLGIAHNVGAVWEVKWCPYGAWQSPLTAASSNVFYPRLGLLAAACGDGKVYIYSIPHPEFLKHEDHRRRICRTEPEVVLHSTFDQHAGETSPCLCVDWQWAEGCGRIMGGYGDGRVHVWDLNTESMLLRVETSDGREIIRPTQGFRAHASCINSIAICQQMPNYVVSVSHDRSFKIWDLHHTDAAVNSSNKMLMKTVKWPLHWPLIYGAGDDCYCLEHNSSFMADLGYFGYSLRPLTVHNSTVWDIDKSEWINTLCAVDAAGEVETMPLPYLITVNKNHKGFTVRRALVHSTHIETKEDAVKDEDEIETRETNICRCDMEITINVEEEEEELEVTQSVFEVCPMCQRLRSGKKQVLGEVQEVVPVEIVSSDMSNMDESYREGDRPHTLQPTPTDKGPPDRLPQYSLVKGMKKQMQTSRIVYRDKKLSKLTTSDRPKLTFSNALRSCKPDVFPLQALYKVRWNPNLGYHTRIATGGQVGIVRLFNLASYETAEAKELTEAEFAAKSSSSDPPASDEESPQTGISR